MSDTFWMKREEKQTQFRELTVEEEMPNTHSGTEIRWFGLTHGLCVRVNDNTFPHLAINSVLSLAIRCQARALPDFSNEFSMPITSISSPPTSSFTPVICFPFPTMHQAHACKGHQRFYYCHIRWLLSIYTTGFLQYAWHFLLTVRCLVSHDRALTIFCLGLVQFIFPGFLPKQYLCILFNSRGLSLRPKPPGLSST